MTETQIRARTVAEIEKTALPALRSCVENTLKDFQKYIKATGKPRPKALAFLNEAVLRLHPAPREDFNPRIAGRHVCTTLDSEAFNEFTRERQADGAFSVMQGEPCETVLKSFCAYTRAL